MRWHGDDGVDDSLLVGNHREERVIIKQLNYSAISPRQRQPRRGSSPELIWEARRIWRTCEQLRHTAQMSPLETEKERTRAEDDWGEEECGHRDGITGKGA